MYLIYLDESGNTGANLTDTSQPVHYVGSLIIHSNQWLQVEQEVEELIASLGVTGIARDNFEFHATDIYQGTGFFRGWSPADRFETLERLLTIVANHHLPLIYAGIHKLNLQSKYSDPAHPHDLAFLLVVERVERWFCSEADTETGIYIADETRAKMDMKTSLRQYRRTGIQFGRSTPINHVIDTIHFADSKETCPIQLADCCLYVIRRKHENKHNIDRFYKIISPLIYDRRIFP